MAKRKRGPPLSYEEKYRQIKDSKFNVDIPRPTSSATKGMVTRYHRLLFGGRKSSGEYSRGLARNYKPVRTKYATDIKAVFGVKGAARIKAAYIPRQFGKVRNVSKTTITLTSPIGDVKFANVAPKELTKANRREKRELLKAFKGKKTQIMIGDSIQTITFTNIDDLLDAIDIAEEAYAQKKHAPIRIINIL